MHIKTLGTIGAALALVATVGCSPASDQQSGKPQASQTADDPASASSSAPGETSPQGTNPVADDSVPARFQGVWDYEGSTCSPDSDLRMEISEREVLFYESVGMVTEIVQDGSDVIVTLDMEGEGETWRQKMRLSLTGSGERQRLETSDGDAPRIVDDSPSRRCA